MKHFNFLSNLLSLSLGSPCTDVSLDRRFTVGSPSGLDAKWMLKLVSVLALIFTLGVGSVWGQVTLTYEWTVSAGKSSLPSGVSESGLGSDYAAANAPYYLKYDGAGDYIQIYTNAAAYEVKFTVKMLGGNSTSKFKVQGCTTASGTYSDIQEFTCSGAQNDVHTFTTSNSINSSYRYFRITKSQHGSNVGFGYLKITKAEKYTITYDAGSGTCATSTWTQTSVGQSTTLPTATPCCDGWSFIGWCTSSAGSSATNPTSPGTILTGSYTPTSSHTLYAIYSKGRGNSTTTFDWTPTTTTGTSFSQDNITATFATGSGGTSPVYNSTGTAMRLYYKNTLQFSGASGITLKSVVFTTHSSNSEFLSGVSVTAGSLSSLTWSSINSSSAKLTNGTVSSGHTRIQKALVTFEQHDFMTSYVACTNLGSINGSVSWLSPDSAEVTWNELSDQVSSWAISWSPNTTGSSGLGIRDKGTTLKDTIIGLACGTQYTFTLTPTLESGVCTLASDCTLVSTSPKYAITLTGGGDITGGVFTSDPEEECASEIITLEAAPNTGFEFTNWEITYTDSGDDAWEDVNGDDDDLVSDGIYIEMPAADITVNAVFSCVEPVIGTQPADASYIKDASPTALSVSATLSSGTLTYLWKVSTNGGSTWSDAGGTNNAATYSGSSLSTASTGTLKFKCIVGNSDGGCSVESDVATITVNAGSTWKFKYEGDDWDPHTMTEADGVASYSISLAADTRYEFGIDDNGTFYKNSGTIITTTSGWVFNTTDNNCKIHTGPAGTYTFAINTTSKAVTVTYPTVDHPNDHYVYFKNTNVWGTVYGYLANSGNDNKAAAWPGSVMSATTTICGETYHYAALNAMSGTYNTIIFNNGNTGYGNQTSDLSTTGSLGKYNANTDANWHQFKYTITYDKGTGSGDAMASNTNLCPGSNQALTACSYTKDHHTFAGWYADVDVKVGESTIEAENIIDDEVTIKDIQSDITLTAQWTANVYTITKTLSNVTNSSLPTSFTYTGATTTALNSTFTVNTTNFFLPSSITVTMGGSTLTAGTDYTYNSSTGAFTFDVTITGDIVITATATAKLMSIAITTAPTKTAYFAGETFSATGAVVTATMGDGTTKAVSGSATWTPTGALTAESGKTMTATYTEAGITKTATTTINVYAVTMQAKDESGDAIAVGGPGAPSRSVTSISPAADAGNYVFKQWTISGASLGSSATTKSNTISTPTGAVTVTAVYYEPRVIKWSVNNDDSYEEGTPTLAVAYNTAISAVPTAPDDDALNSCANKFMGWSTTNITKGSPVTAADDIAALGLFTNASGYTTKITAATTTFYAVFAESNSGTKSLTHDEITSFYCTGDACGGATNAYKNQTVSSSDGDWSGLCCSSLSSSVNYVNIKAELVNSARPYLQSPTYSGQITNIAIRATHGANSTRTLYICSSSEASPATNNIGTLSISKNNESIQNIVPSSSTDKIYLYSDGAIMIYSITVSYGSAENYVTQCADNQVRVTYDFNGGTGTACTEGVTTKSASYTVCSTEPEKDYYDFAGWSDGTNTYDAGDTYNLQATTEFTATWTPTVYTISYTLNGGTQQVTPAAPTSYTVESSAVTLPTPTKSHDRFDGWYANVGLTGDVQTTIAAGSNGNKEYWAKWTARNEIKFYADDNLLATIYRAADENLQASVAGQGSKPSDPDAPSACSSKVFMGWTETWFNDETDTEPADLNDATGTRSGAKTYYAVWATRAGSPGSYTYSAYSTTCCGKSVEVDGGSPSNGTVTFDKSYAWTCKGDREIVMTITPAAGYQLHTFSVATGDGKVAAKSMSADVVLDNNSSAAQVITLTFAKDADGAYDVTATFAEMTVTSWTWTYNSSDIPDPIDVYVGQKKQIDVVMSPSGVLTSHKNNLSYTYDVNSTYIGNPNRASAYFTFEGKAATESTTITLTHNDDTSSPKAFPQTVNVRVKPLPLVHFVDNVHNESFDDVVATVSGDKLSVSMEKTTPTHVDFTGSTSNSCEETHLHLIGWIDGDWAPYAAYMAGTGDKPTISAITGATGYFYAPGADIDLVAKDGKTFYAVWANVE